MARQTMDEDDGYRASLEEDAVSEPSVTQAHPSDNESRRSVSSAGWDGDTEFNVIASPSFQLPPSMARDLEIARSSQATPHSRHKSLASTGTLTNNYGYDVDTDREGPSGRPSNISDMDRSTILADLLIASAPRLRHLASQSSITTTSTIRSQSRFRGKGKAPSSSNTSLATPASEQRHPGKPGVRLSRYSRPFEPVIEEDDEDGGAEVPAPPGQDGHAEEEAFLHGLPLALLVIGLSLVVFLISIDRTIITTAIPYITGEFKSTADIGWYGSSYLLTACAFQPVFGRVFTLFNTKWSYLLSMFVFMVGSIISGWAPSSTILIIGRAIAGLGSAGILTGSFVIVAIAVPLTVRPVYTAVVGLMFGVGATVGPLIGGVFTQLLTWRWCFWINLPIGGFTMTVMFIVFHPRSHGGPQRSFIDRIVDLDLIGNVILLAASVMLFLALEFSLTGAAWGSAKIIGLLCGAVVTTVCFIVWLWWRQDVALIPPAIARQKTVTASCLMAFFVYGALLIQTYFLPIWFQAILNYSAIQSGVAMIPYFVSNALFSLFSGIFVSIVGYFTPPAILGCAIGTVGCGIFTLFNPKMTMGMWIGIEVLASAGFGMSIQQGFTAVQTVLRPEDIAVGTASVVASQSLGGAVFLSVGNSIFQNRLQNLIAGAKLEGIDVDAIVAAGAVSFRDIVSADQLPKVLGLYNDALHSVFYAAIPLAGLAFVSCCFLEWRSVKPPPKPVDNS
ncbi:MFS general substrate transporter [Xylariaceae sp. FL0016]|nr:MFS general substrate transporter [Xylariaceae sp. FL0016]